MKRWFWMLVSTYVAVSCSTNSKKGDNEDLGVSSSSEQSFEMSSSLKGSSSSLSSSSSALERIGTFNLGAFGKTKSTNSKLLQGLKTIAANYSILSVQEIRDVSGESCKRLLAEVSKVGLSGLCSLPDGRTASKEQYALLYSNFYELVGQAAYEDSQDLFERSPWHVQLKDKRNGAMLLVFSVHIKPDDAVNELSKLDTIVSLELSKIGLKDALVMGDFNAGCTYLSKAEYAVLGIFKAPFRDATGDIDTNVSQTHCSYDKIVEIGSRFDELNHVTTLPLGDYESDHLPVIATEGAANAAASSALSTSSMVSVSAASSVSSAVSSSSKNSQVAVSSASSVGVCGSKTTCGQMVSCDEARYFLTTCGVRSLDGDGDGTPCEAICK